MVILYILGGLIVLGVVVYFVEPSLYALLYSWVLGLFVKNPPFVDVDEEFPEHTIIKENFPIIREELEKVLLNSENIPKFHEVDNLQRFISAKDEVPWRTFIIKGYNNWHDKNSQLVPKTTEVLKQVPQITTALFSILDGGKHIPPHVGFFKGVYRYHLALVVPDDAPVFIEVGGEEYSWKEGEDVLFDDTYRHQVWNKSEKRRVVLFCDLLRDKDLPRWARGLNRRMHGLLERSPKLKKAAKKAEVPQDAAAGAQTEQSSTES
jgi:beta-hydroxylase